MKVSFFFNFDAMPIDIHVPPLTLIDQRKSNGDFVFITSVALAYVTELLPLVWKKSPATIA